MTSTREPTSASLPDVLSQILALTGKMILRNKLVIILSFLALSVQLIVLKFNPLFCKNQIISYSPEPISGIVRWFWLTGKNLGTPTSSKSLFTGFPNGEDEWQTGFLSSGLIRIFGFLLAKVIGPICTYNVIYIILNLVLILALQAIFFKILQDKIFSLSIALVIQTSPIILYKGLEHFAYILLGLYLYIFIQMSSKLKEPTKIRKFGFYLICLNLFIFIDGYYLLLIIATLFSFLLFGLSQINKKYDKDYMYKNILLVLNISIILLFAFLIKKFSILSEYRYRKEIDFFRWNFREELQNSLQINKNVIPLSTDFTSYGNISILIAILLLSFYLLFKNKLKIRFTESELFLLTIIVIVFQIRIPYIEIGFMDIIEKINLNFFRATNRFAPVIYILVLFIIIRNINEQKLLKKWKIIKVFFASLLVLNMYLMWINRIELPSLSNVNSSYWWVKKNVPEESALYHFNDRRSDSYYIAYQLIHEHKLMNHYLSNNKIGSLALGIADSQTPCLLSAYGVRYVIYPTREDKNSLKKLENFNVRYFSDSKDGTFDKIIGDFYNGNTSILELNRTFRSSNSFFNPDSNFEIDEGKMHVGYWMISKVANITINPLNSGLQSKAYFDSTSYSLKPVTLRIYDDNQLIWKGTILPSGTRIRIENLQVPSKLRFELKELTRPNEIFPDSSDTRSLGIFLTNILTEDCSVL